MLLTCLGGLSAQTATFSNFTYNGNDACFDKDIDASRQYLNPILSGFYPDPSICRKDDRHYLVNSSFSFFPGVPIFTSKDMVHWEQIGNVLDRPSQLPLDGQGVSGGIYAPQISYDKYNDTFYMITTNVGKGTFFVKTKDPAKGWGEPIYLPKIDGIDPSFLFDNGGKAYIVHNAPVMGSPDYDGQTAIRLFSFDVKGDSIIGGPTEIVRGGAHVVDKPIWIEGPHLYHIGKFYYLMCAEGGTAEGHSEVIFRAKSPMGPWEENPSNPILTQRDGLDPNRPDKVTSTGHADLVQTPKGDWWAVFLGCRPYEGDLYNTGRETFLLPVTWKDGFPVILPKGTPVPTVVDKPNLTVKGSDNVTGNFFYSTTFDNSELSPEWVFLRNPQEDFYQFNSNGIVIRALPVSVSEIKSPAAIFYRQKNTAFSAETTVMFNPRSSKDLAGITLFQNEGYNFVLGVTRMDGKQCVTLMRTEKGNSVLIASALLNQEGEGMVKLSVTGNGRYYGFYFSNEHDPMEILATGVDASNLSTNKAGGFIGTMIGLYATSNN